MDDYIIEAFEDYLDKCPCTDKEDCKCLTLSKFTDQFLRELADEWAENRLADQEEFYA